MKVDVQECLRCVLDNSVLGYIETAFEALLLCPDPVTAKLKS